MVTSPHQPISYLEKATKLDPYRASIGSVCLVSAVLLIYFDSVTHLCDTL